MKTKKRPVGRPATGQTRIHFSVGVTEAQYAKLLTFCERERIGTSIAVQRLLDALPVA